MKTNLNLNIEEALCNFYLEADKDTIEGIIQEEVLNINEYNKKRNKLLFIINAKAIKLKDEQCEDIVRSYLEKKKAECPSFGELLGERASGYEAGYRHCLEIIINELFGEGANSENREK